MNIRNFKNSDLDEVIRISEISFGKSFDPRLYGAISDNWPEAFIVYEENGRVRGFLAGSLAYDTEARILMLAVHPDFRNMGIGRSLLERFVSVCNTKGVRRIYLEVKINNKKAIDFYMKCGFSKGSVYPGYYESGEDGLIMWKSL